MSESTMRTLSDNELDAVSGGFSFEPSISINGTEFSFDELSGFAQGMLEDTVESFLTGFLGSFFR
ncbi:bacteriocin [Halomonas binhaiensis]|uniref:Bacteriocin n=1 Tax=Halomonas binhaiensis TaxID=2562282 RepID=A0A5C1NEK8_9GAMM|nr:bacteriocin [Halomonas binhaiensis]QEM81694.1 bacteriocin [Halomonas binhaiensis]